MSITYKEYLALAIPFVISTITQPLLGAVDTAVLGHLSSSVFMGAVAVGTVIFNTVYWLFGFLRVSTTGFSAQSLGSDNKNDSFYSYFRPLFIAILISFLFIILQIPIKQISIYLFHLDKEVEIWMTTYFDILIWGAPFVLVSYVNLGWLMGRRCVKETLILQISMNIINIILDLLFVLVFDWGVKGVAYATLICQIYGFFLGIFLINKKLDLFSFHLIKEQILQREKIKEIISVNNNLFIRTLCLLIMTNIFIALGSNYGNNTLAANAILLQIQYIIAYFYDGFSNATSSYAGRATAQKDLDEYKKIIKISNVSGLLLSLFLTIILIFSLDHIILIFTNIKEVILLCKEYSMWLTIFPFCICFGLIYYGLFVGSTFTKPIQESMIYSLLVFLLSISILIPYFGNHGLWLSFILFSFSRSLFLYLYIPKLLKKIKKNL